MKKKVLTRNQAKTNSKEKSNQLEVIELDKESNKQDEVRSFN